MAMDSKGRRIRLSKSVVGEAEAAAVARVVLENGFFSMGNETRTFESELATFFGGAREVVCVNTGTSALHLAAQACGIGRGDEVIVATMTFIATFQALTATGATVVPADVRESDCWLDLADVESRITSRTKAIVPVHFAGGPGDLAALYELADRHGLRVIEDAAHAFGSSYDGNLVGAQGDVACFGFDGLKNITAGEGGAIVTSDDAVVEKVREGRLLGIHIAGETRLGGQRWDFDVFDQGWRYHMSDLFAALGGAKLKRFEGEFKPKRLELARRYDELLARSAERRADGLRLRPGRAVHLRRPGHGRLARPGAGRPHGRRCRVRSQLQAAAPPHSIRRRRNVAADGRTDSRGSADASAACRLHRGRPTLRRRRRRGRSRSGQAGSLVTK